MFNSRTQKKYLNSCKFYTSQTTKLRPREFTYNVNRETTVRKYLY